ncbi:dihydroorotase, homodimeric type [Spizellomyces punctatus DAOM BR117]|uniref:dihydroorotase n=1 Tax=Spizellomyces punctatus (strain DAOM BR117) TaxID=645134 RepID=A0A0L0HJ20_SPIPD|nr:dihydroorotase, homodimeric type [Spizellomyces punctatus DAOM BR117]KND00895.1 dihydroorotase, homodimeric type [Spizellomyces punctatus DAOM BR117]|eukprot:XP_016608934.1 dihydroorotase, homodimeric type [Spizellomyces punctatus DAOM BR117]
MSITTLSVPLADDFHTHLRQGALMRAVTPLLKTSGVATAYVMPNLKPPVTTTEQALAYKAELEALAPNVNFLMTLYLTPELTPEEIRKAAKAGVAGVKSYPRGVTTNSDSGIESYTAYYEVFRAMEEVDMVLNLHGEIPSDAEEGVCVMNAEERFLKHLEQLHRDFPNLRIVLEHATTKAAVDMVKSLGATVGCSITVHHLSLIVDDWAGQCHHFCKPVAKYPHDREALRAIVKEGHPRFFLGTDSAPHPRHTKESSTAVAGVFTTPLVLPYLATILESFGALDKLQTFACENGRAFYKLPTRASTAPVATLFKQEYVVPKEYTYTDDEGHERSVVPFLAGKKLAWTLKA